MFIKRALLFLVLISPILFASAGHAGAVRPGLDNNTLSRNDDGSTSLTPIGFDINFYGVIRSAMYINNNGNITLDSRLSTYTPFNISTAGREIIAPFFGDVDTRRAGLPVTYGPGTVGGRPAYGINWVEVDCYNSSSSRSVRNSFQLVLIERNDTGPDNFDFEFNYNQIQWDSGQASGGNFNCLNGSSARAGYSNGTSVDSYELPGSGVQGAFLDSGPAGTALIHNSLNSSVLGRYVFSARDGEIVVNINANAGNDRTVDENTFVQLDGSNSLPAGGVNYSWQQTGGPVVVLTGANTVAPSFTAPAVSSIDVTQTLTFELTVDDGTHVSDPDTVDILVRNVNQAPVADAGDDTSIREGAGLTLNGSYSNDPDNDELAYLWTQISGPAAVLSDDMAVNPSFTAPLGSATLQFQLQVSDGSLFNDAGSDPDDVVTISVTENNAPVANTGGDVVVNEGLGVVMQLSGAGSSDPDSDGITYAWTQVAGDAVTLDDPASATPSFEPGPMIANMDFVFQLQVTDDYAPNIKTSLLIDNGSAADSYVTVRVLNSNAPPSCDLAYPSVSSFWPPNHKMETVNIDGVLAQDDPYPDVVLIITGATQDEPINGLGDGDTSPDAMEFVGSPRDSVRLRAERSGNGNGRVYTINFGASDGFESCVGSVQVTVPHSRKSTAVDDGQIYSSTEE